MEVRTFFRFSGISELPLLEEILCLTLETFDDSKFFFPKNLFPK